jgi:hypothetical protein
VQIAADVGGRSIAHCRLIAQRCDIKVVGAAKEGKGVRGDRRKLAGQPLGIAAMVEGEDGLRGGVHGLAFRSALTSGSGAAGQRKNRPRVRKV